MREDNYGRIYEKLGIEDRREGEERFRIYMREILEKNRSINLTAIEDEEEFMVKHFFDSLMCASSGEFREADNIVDIGTGAGFPGIPLAALFPEKNFVLIDSLRKRIDVIREAASGAGIKNAVFIHGRAEELARKKDMREGFELCVSRAVAPMNILAEYCLPFVKVGGAFIAYKGPSWEGEMAEAERALEVLGGRFMRKEDPPREIFPLDHKLIYIGKIKSTGSKFPRKAGTPSKNPIK